MLVTGGANGIGRGIVDSFLQGGAAVLLRRIFSLAWALVSVYCGLHCCFLTIGQGFICRSRYATSTWFDLAQPLGLVARAAVRLQAHTSFSATPVTLHRSNAQLQKLLGN